jgi:uncharacterized protein (DUF1015 family)
MANIVPFCGVRYNLRIAGNLSGLITPPYDVIDEQAQHLYYEKTPYNIIRLEYGEIRASDDSRDNRYTRAAAYYRHWLDEGVLLHDNQPSVYLYEQEFSFNGGRLTRSGFISGIGLESYDSGVILPHEETLSHAKADRLELLSHCRANFSPIFGLYDDPSLSMENIAARYKQDIPLVTFEDENGEFHRLWLVQNEQDLFRIQQLFLDKKIYIADGHHRYETALHHHREAQATGENQYGFVMMALVNLHDPGLVILPTHRLVRNVPDFSPQLFLNKLGTIFEITSSGLPGKDRDAFLCSALRSTMVGVLTDHLFSVYLGDGRLYRLSLPRGKEHQGMCDRYGSRSEAWRGLDVAILQCLVFENILGIGREALQSGTNLSYSRNEARALDDVDAGIFQAAIFLNPPLVQEVIGVAAAGEKMPQKSTYFYPKLVTGLVINDFKVSQV